MEFNELTSHIHEGLVYIIAVFGTDLIARDLAFSGELLEPGCFHLPQVTIGLIAQHTQLHVGLRELLDLTSRLSYLIEPEVIQVLEAALIGDVVHRENAMCALIVGARNCSETLLACGVPDLQFHDIPVDW